MITIASASAGRLIYTSTCIYGPRYLYNCNFFPLFHRRRPTRKRLRLRTLQVPIYSYNTRVEYAYVYIIYIYNTMSGVTDLSTRGNFKYFFSSLRPQHTRAYTVSYCDHFSLLLAFVSIPSILSSISISSSRSRIIYTLSSPSHSHHHPRGPSHDRAKTVSRFYLYCIYDT